MSLSSGTLLDKTLPPPRVWNTWILSADEYLSADTIIFALGVTIATVSSIVGYCSGSCRGKNYFSLYFIAFSSFLFKINTKYLITD